MTTRLTESPACLVADEHDMGGNLERLLKAAGQKVPRRQADPRDQSRATRSSQRLKAEDARFGDWAQLLFDQALLAEGGQLEDPAGFVKRSNELMLSLAPE